MHGGSTPLSSGPKVQTLQAAMDGMMLQTTTPSEDYKLALSEVLVELFMQGCLVL